MIRPPDRRSQADRHAETERRVIEAAVYLIAQRGSRAVSLADIGLQAGYSRGIVNHHFGSKQALLAAVMRDSQQFEVPHTDDGGLNELLILVRAYIENVRRGQPGSRAFLVLWTEALTSDTVLAPLFAERDEWFRTLLANYVRRGIADASMSADLDPDTVAVFTVGLLRGVSMQLMSGHQLPSTTALIESVLETLRRGLRPPGSETSRDMGTDGNDGMTALTAQWPAADQV